MPVEEGRKIRSLSCGIAATAVSIALVLAPGHGVAYADPIGSGSATATSASTSGDDSAERSGPKKPPSRKSDADPGTAAPSDGGSESEPPRGDDDDVAAPSDSSDVVVVEPDETETDPTEVPETEVSEPEAPETPETAVPETAADGSGADSAVPEDTDATVAAPEPPAPSVVSLAPAKPHRAYADEPTSALAAVSTVAPVEITTPSPPQPLSPIAQLLELPGRLINAVLQALGFTASANHPPVPNGLGPINDLIFGAFRELERLIGLHRPVVVPEVPTLTYDGPTTSLSPTVAQFLNASAAAYVLGGTPGGLVPFTVNGFQLSKTNLFTGMVAKTWVTPEGQVIIAYQGTTGGSHLLFNPLITISQILADMQVIFTRTTPPAFYDALRFADRVLVEAAMQGYTADNVFVTGHSLGGWEAQFVAQQLGLAGIGFEAPGINTRTPGNGADSLFVNIGTYGSTAPYMATDLPGLQPFMPAYVPGGGTKPHYGPIVMIGDPAAMTPLYNASALWGKGLIGSAIFMVDFLINFFQYHLPGVQAYHLDVVPDPGMVLFLGTSRGPVRTGYGELTIQQLLKTASDDGILFRP
ncbi:hemolysin-type calcium-binding protein [Methylobacterium nodulans ORS 2060] [Mycolicibacterium parafortuitum]|uniref:Hemolysin-type calcium-binding protein [Methylobacterium nodulans ORS 2060] n=1 Tax=Mycolicibacterium parafortuitum TaxID=39692 RepID=A0A375YBL7_MYCPF|nr:hemolysin-type calcium-binding protein [Methylobacterium nodulans ORS 2060] [Mycolicibacterium parafortuitum]